MKVRKNTKLTLSILVTISSSIIFGISLTITNIITMKSNFTEAVNSLIISIIFLGGLLGTLIVPILFRSIKHTIIFANVLFLIGTAPLRFSSSPLVYIIGRFVFGLGSGIICVCVPLYHAELKVKKLKHIIESFHQLAMVTGGLTGQVMTYYANEKNCVDIISYYILFIGIIFILSFFIKDKTTKLLEIGYKELFEDKNEKKKLETAILLQILQQGSGINGVILYSSEIFKTDKNLDFKLCTVHTGFVSLLCTIISIVLASKYTDINLLTLSTAIIVSSLICLAFDYYILYSIFLFIAGFNIGIGPVPLIYVAKVFDIKNQKAGVSIAVAINWMVGFLVTFLFPYLLLHKFFCYLGFAFLTMGLFLGSIHRM